jgi:dynein heavy chain
MEKRKRTLLGAPAGKKCIIFVDDVNMPAVETYGAQPPIELLRQFQDHKGFYERKKLFWRNIADTVLFVCSAPPGGGRNELTPRCASFLLVFFFFSSFVFSEGEKGEGGAVQP